MKKQLFSCLFALFFLSGLSAQQRGDIVFDSLLHFYDPLEIGAVYDGFELPTLLFPIHFSVELYKVVYRTPAATGDTLTLASGLVALPVSEGCALPLSLYSHGSLPYDSVVSELNARFDQHLFGIPFAANGYVMAIPDYLGYGATPLDHPHPYLHAQSGATAVVDMLRATRALCEKVGTNLNEQLFLLGYSQGGHVTMAAHRELEAKHTDEFTVTASAPCSGPYDLSGISRDSLLFTDRFAHPFFVTFTALSYQYVYGNLYGELEDMFVEPYPDLIRRMFDRRNPDFSLLSSLPYPATGMLDPLYYDDIVTDPEHPLNQDLRDNDVYDWIPLAPVRLFYCGGDERAPYENSVFTADHMTQKGAADVQSVLAGAWQNHEECTYPAIIFAKLWLDTYRTTCSTPTEELAGLDGQVFLYPNPFAETVFIGGNHLVDFRQVRVYDLMGRELFSQYLQDHTFISLPAGQLPAGSYIFELFSETGRYRQVMLRSF